MSDSASFEVTMLMFLCALHPPRRQAFLGLVDQVCPEAPDLTTRCQILGAVDCVLWLRQARVLLIPQLPAILPMVRSCPITGAYELALGDSALF